MGVIQPKSVLLLQDANAAFASLNNLDVSAVLVRPDKYISDTAKTDEEVAKLAMLEIPKLISNIKEREITI